MSYILEALDKAEAERALGAVPGLHAPLAVGPLPPARLDTRRRLLLILPLALALLLVLAALVWYRQPAPVAATPRPPVSASAQPAAPAAALAAPPAAPTLPATASAAPIRPSVQSGVAKPRSVPTAEPLRLKKPALPASTPELDVRLPTLRELPDTVQHEIPALTVGGYIYSDNRAERSLLVNNKLLREGDEVAAGLTLEKMMPKAAVLNYKGYRYRIAY